MKTYLINDEWYFSLNAPVNSHLMSADTESFEKINIPHDWSIGLPFDKDEGELCTAFLPGGHGWYRREFVTTNEMKDKLVFLVFEGIYNNATIYCNGEYIEMHPYGYTSFFLDITEYLLSEGELNLIAVSVDRTRVADSRWYTGSGIYRDVQLMISDKIHIPIWGVAIEPSKIINSSCSVIANIKVNNFYNEDACVELVVKITNPEGVCIANFNDKLELLANEINDVKVEISVDDVSLWSPETPVLYRYEVEVKREGLTCDTFSTPFGVRSFNFDVNEGFFLNGESTLIKGVCLHQELGVVGSAVPDALWRKYLSTFKECGCNAIRTAHNPPSTAFLNICDEMGFLVQVEFFDEWYNPKDKRKNGPEQSVDYRTRSYTEHFGEWAKRDLQDTIKRTINHPCIIQWGIGNEIEWTYTKYNNATGYFGAEASGNYFWECPPYSKEEIRQNIAQIPREKHDICETANKLSQWVKELDQSRPVIANCIFPSVSYESGYTDALDIVGYSYRQVMYEYGHKNYSDKPIMGTESLGQWHEWKHVVEKKYLAGLFLWAGMDYLGEVGHVGAWPMKGLPYGLLDFTGHPKHSYYMYKSLWQDEPTIHIATNTLQRSLYQRDSKGDLREKNEGAWQRRLWAWHEMNYHWNYTDNDEIVVEIYSNCESVTLYLNDKDLGTRELVDFDDRIYKWSLPFESGILKAIGDKNGVVQQETLVTTGKVTSISISSEDESINVGVNDIAYITVQLLDDELNHVTCCERDISFNIRGQCEFLGVDNGDVCNVRGYKQHSVSTHHGRCILLLQGTEIATVMVSAETQDGLKSSVSVEVE